MHVDDTMLFCDINNIPDVEHSMSANLRRVTVIKFKIVNASTKT